MTCCLCEQLGYAHLPQVAMVVLEGGASSKLCSYLHFITVLQVCGLLGLRHSEPISLAMYVSITLHELPAAGHMC